MSSIAKQITYAQYIDSHFDFDKVRNVFLLPFNAKVNRLLVYHCSGWTVADWVDDAYAYKKIYTILVDTKYLMRNRVWANIEEVRQLSVTVNNIIELTTQGKSNNQSITT